LNLYLVIFIIDSLLLKKYKSLFVHSVDIANEYFFSFMSFQFETSGDNIIFNEWLRN